MPPVVILADRRDHGQTLAAVLKSRLNLTWSQAKRVIDRRHVRVGGQIIADSAYRVKTGKRITVAEGVLQISKPESKTVEKPKPRPAVATKKSKPIDTAKQLSPEFRPEVLYSDDAIVVVNKPAGLTTMRHAEEAAEFGKGKRFLPKTLADALPTMLGQPGKPVIAVHRIDRDTSGVVVFARTPSAAKHLMTQFKKHTTDRRYLALVRGTPTSGRIESMFVSDRGDGRRGSGTGEEVKKAVTFVKLVGQFGSFALVECRLETGRTHQVRIHLGEGGTPLCGEKVYDRPVDGKPLADGSGAKRPMLHAQMLGFAHPVSGERMTYTVEPPKDFADLLAKFAQGHATTSQKNVPS